MPIPNETIYKLPYGDNSGSKIEVKYINPVPNDCEALKDPWVVIKGMGSREGETAHIPIENLEWLQETIRAILDIEERRTFKEG